MRFFTRGKGVGRKVVPLKGSGQKVVSIDSKAVVKSYKFKFDRKLPMKLNAGDRHYYNALLIIYRLAMKKKKISDRLIASVGNKGYDKLTDIMNVKVSSNVDIKQFRKDYSKFYDEFKSDLSLRLHAEDYEYISARIDGFSMDNIKDWVNLNRKDVIDPSKSMKSLPYESRMFFKDIQYQRPFDKMYVFDDKDDWFPDYDASTLKRLMGLLSLPARTITGVYPSAFYITYSKKQVMAEKIMDKYKGTSPQWTFKGVPDVI